MSCEHKNFYADVKVNRIAIDEGGPIERFNADLRIKCTDCGKPFVFIGLGHGVNLDGAACSLDGQEACLAIAPEGEVLTDLKSRTPLGFTVRRTA